MDNESTGTSYALDVARTISLPAERVYRAFTDQLDQWFGTAGSLVITPEPGGLYHFVTEMDDQRHPHYGRFIELVPGQRVSMTWMTGDPGTLGAETVVAIDITGEQDVTRVRVQQSGFYDEASRDGHADAWPMVLEHLENTLDKD
jgi:uncharacterized protein YndB with AHSA1/START domain